MTSSVGRLLRKGGAATVHLVLLMRQAGRSA
jgi:hypothetical protein